MTAVTITQLILSALCAPPAALLLLSPWWEPAWLRKLALRWHVPRHRKAVPAYIIRGPRLADLPAVEAYAVSGYTGGTP